MKITIWRHSRRYLFIVLVSLFFLILYFLSKFYKQYFGDYDESANQPLRCDKTLIRKHFMNDKRYVKTLFCDNYLYISLVICRNFRNMTLNILIF